MFKQFWNHLISVYYLRHFGFILRAFVFYYILYICAEPSECDAATAQSHLQEGQEDQG